MKSSVIIPALNEEDSIGYVLASIPLEKIAEIIVVDGGSTDNTVSIAEDAGALVIREPRRGYGRACATGVEHANGEILIFLDADGADDPAEIQVLAAPIQAGEADMVLGSRLAGELETNAMPWQQFFGNRLSAWLIRLLYRIPVTDLSPFRAVRKSKLMDLGMTEMTYGWPTEMIVKAARQGWRMREIPVRYRSRYGGSSKISGTLRGTVLATYYIISTILRYALSTEDKSDTKASPNQNLP